MTKNQKILIQLVKYVLKGEKLPDEYRNLSTEEKKSVIEFSREQALVPFLQYYDMFSTEDVRNMFISYFASYIFQDSRQQAELDELLDVFEQNRIYCMPLKGILTKEYYPDSELRTMGDLDLLYKKEQTAELRAVMEASGFGYEGEAAKHDHYEKNGLIIEMHKYLVPAESRAYHYFQKCWDRATLQDGKKYICRMSLEDHYLYSLFHLIEHFIRGGIGVRMVLDLYILSGLPRLDWDYLNRELSVLGVRLFSERISHLAEVWFGEEEYGQADFELEDYIINGGGVYGNEENMIKNSGVIYRSGTHFLFHAVFPPYRVMQSVFPWLNNPLFLPVAWVIRFRNVWKKRRRNIHIQFDRAAKMNGEEKEIIQRQKKFLERMGLSGMR